ncbi:beta-ketoacyl synthase N-terminal-like domain-containing protein [Micromonospora sp. NPDC049204]|uniref:beta-ketoacyl-[acyl-carrier-protein] synthase family protein n=1 Tax=unclassified Micromonospora TaxID=2617518 RepID=UPI0033FDD665
MTTLRSVVVTGIGAVSCLGADVPAFWRGLLAARSAPSAIGDPLAHMPYPLVYQVDNRGVPAGPQAVADVPLGRAARFAVAAGRAAVADAGLTEPETRAAALVFGSEMGNSDVDESRRADGASDPRSRWHSAAVTAAAVSTTLGLAGASTSISNACAASGYAMVVALDMIRSGEHDTVLVGGAEGRSRVALGAFNRLGAVDPDRCRPFDRHRRGTIFGEGAAMLVLQDAATARRHGRTPYAEVAGGAWSCDGYHATAPEPTARQLLRAMGETLGESGLGAGQIGCVIPHGTGTRHNDVMESRALCEFFGTYRPPLLSLKSSLGHTAGAAMAFACVAAALVLRHGLIPPSPRLGEQDPECDVWIPQDEPVPIGPAAILLNALAFGGNNVSLLIKGLGT